MKQKIYTSVLQFSAEGGMSLQDEVRMVTGVQLGVGTPMSKEGRYKADGFKSDSLSFGWIGNDPKFYSGVNAEKLKPKPEDFVVAPYRLLSAAIVGAYSWKATDFRNQAALKAGMHMLSGKTVYKEHETETDNWVGFVNEVKWSDDTVDPATKLMVPGGIDGMLAIDSVTNPKVARGVLLGTVYSNSVGVRFNWKMSHAFEDVWDFYERCGTFGDDGRMICREMTEIVDFFETSLVYRGADPFAKMRNEDGSLKNIEVSSVVYSAGRAESQHQINRNDRDLIDYTQRRSYSLGLDVAAGVAYIRPVVIETPQEDPPNMKQIDALLAATRTALSLQEADEIPADVAEQVAIIPATAHQALLASKTENSALLAAVAALLPAKAEGETFTVAEVTALLAGRKLLTEEEFSTLSAQSAEAEFGKKHLNDLRAEAVRLYRLSAGANATEAVEAMFNTAQADAIEGLLATYGVTASKAFGAMCSKCNSSEYLTYRRSLHQPETDPETFAAVKVTAEDIYDKMTTPGVEISK